MNRNIWDNYELTPLQTKYQNIAYFILILFSIYSLYPCTHLARTGELYIDFLHKWPEKLQYTFHGMQHYLALFICVLIWALFYYFIWYFNVSDVLQDTWQHHTKTFQLLLFHSIDCCKSEKKNPCVSVVVVFVVAFSYKNFNLTHDVHASMKIPPS